jgi:AraC-like DNA-binding protein
VIRMQAHLLPLIGPQRPRPFLHPAGTDPVAGPALAVLHTQPSRDWTVPSLAAAIGVSRATLARRFPPPRSAARPPPT